MVKPAKWSVLSLFLSAGAFSQGVITTFAGTSWIFPGNGPSANSPLGSLQGVTLNAHGNIYHRC